VRTLYYGDNLDNLRRLDDDMVDLCYIDPPFNSKRSYNQIYDRVKGHDVAQAQAFIDTWSWDDQAREGYTAIISNAGNRFPVETVELVKGFRNALGEDSLLAYLVSMTLRVAEIHRVLKRTGSFFLHCDPTASHYLKVVLDSIFGYAQCRNEVIWDYSFRLMHLPQFFNRKHDVILFYAKGKKSVFHMPKTPWTREDLVRSRKQQIHTDKDGVEWIWMPGGKGNSKSRLKRVDELLSEGKAISDVWPIPVISSSSKERLGYQTQKPEALLQRIIEATTNEGDLILDAYCGCGTTIAVAEKQHREWIGMDITFQAISLVLTRLPKTVAAQVYLDGVPRDYESAVSLAHKKDDRLRKEFEKWAILTYTDNRARINEKKGADGGLDGVGYFWTDRTTTAKITFQVKSGAVSRGDVARLKGDMQRERAELAVLITLQKPSRDMRLEAKRSGQYTHQITGALLDRIRIVEIRDIVEQGDRLNDVPLTLDILRASERAMTSARQGNLQMEDGIRIKKQVSREPGTPAYNKEATTGRLSF
jgi:DNA modification methylase